MFRGVISLLHVQNVTALDFDDNDLPHYDLTPQTLTWDPTSNDYGVQERVQEDEPLPMLVFVLVFVPPPPGIIGSEERLTIFENDTHRQW